MGRIGLWRLFSSGCSVPFLTAQLQRLPAIAAINHITFPTRNPATRTSSAHESRHHASRSHRHARRVHASQLIDIGKVDFPSARPGCMSAASIQGDLWRSSVITISYSEDLRYSMKSSLQPSKGSSYRFRGYRIRRKELPNLVLQLVLPPSLPPSFCLGLLYLLSLIKRLPHNSPSTRMHTRHLRAWTEVVGSLRG